MWNEIWKIVLGVLVSVGGIGGIIIFVIKFSVELIAKRLEEKYTLKLNKELEKYKSRLDNKIYISKTKFDAEFSIYRELSKSFFDMVKNINSMIPIGLVNVPADKEVRKKFENECYENACRSVVQAQDTLISNAPFMSSELFEKYDEILKLCRLQLSAFEKRWNVLYIASQEEKESFSGDDYLRGSEIQNKFTDLIKNIREYLTRLDVLD